MKFLCPQCKAKYRIADEKLAQRASSKMKCRKCGHVIDIHSAAMPDSLRAGPNDDDDDEEEQPAPRVGVPRVVPAPAAAKRAPAAAAAPPAKRTPAQPQKRSPAVAPPRRGASAAVAQAVREATTPDEQPAIQAKPVAPPAKNEFEEEMPTRIHDGAALAAAFSVGLEDSFGGAAPQAAPEEWYVGIDGSPVGPLTFAELREKASSGKATLESLVWKEGFEDWKPLSAFPELVGLVEESKRASAIPPVAVVAAAPAAAPMGLNPAATAPEAKVVISDRPDSMMDELSIGRRPKPASHPMAWIAVLVALVFGITIGVVLFSKTEQKEVVKYVEVPASAKAPEDVVATDPKVLEESTVSGGTTTRKSGAGSGKTDTPPPATTGKSLLTGLNGLNGLGPSKGPDAPENQQAGGQLDGTAIQRVVATFSPGVKRGCWQPALEGRTPDAPSSARIGLTIVVASSGNVENVTTTGDPKGYPGLSRCIQSKVQGWKFPRSSGTTTVQVPFVFAAQ